MTEYLDIVDENGQATGLVVDRIIAHAQGIRHRTAHLWLVRNKDDVIQVLLQKRAKNKDAFPNCYDISSAGHIPAGEGFEASAVRELREELGITARENDLIFCADRNVVWDGYFNGKPFHDRQYSRVYMLWADIVEDEFALEQGEVESVRWMSLAECVFGVEKHLFENCIAMEELQILSNALAKAGYAVH